jgi:hypothetical protein
MKQLLPSIARTVEAAKLAKASEEEGKEVYLCYVKYFRVINV